MATSLPGRRWREWPRNNGRLIQFVSDGSVRNKIAQRYSTKRATAPEAIHSHLNQNPTSRIQPP